jgi:glutamate-ammonia-ligase adenylyltransferase
VAFRQRLAEGAGAPDFETLTARLKEVRASARAAFDQALPPVGDGDSSASR